MPTALQKKSHEVEFNTALQKCREEYEENVNRKEEFEEELNIKECRMQQIIDDCGAALWAKSRVCEIREEEIKQLREKQEQNLIKAPKMKPVPKVTVQTCSTKADNVQLPMKVSLTKVKPSTTTSIIH